MKNKTLIIISIVIICLLLCIVSGMFGIKLLKREYHKRLNAQINERYAGSSSVLVLTYHHLLNKDDKEKYFKDNMYVATTEDFEEQLKYLKENGYNSISSDDLYDWLQFKTELPEKSVLITFDDGYTSTYKYALPLLEKYGYKSIVFCTGNVIKDTTEIFDPSILQFMGYDLINDIKNNHPILEIGAHSDDLHDKSISNYSYEEIYEDVLSIKNKLNTDLYSYPGGHYNYNYLKAIKNANYKMAFKYKPSSRTHNTDNIYALSRIEVIGNIDIEGFKELLY